MGEAEEGWGREAIRPPLPGMDELRVTSLLWTAAKGSEALAKGEGALMMSRRNAWRLVVAIFVLSVAGCAARNAQISNENYQACLAANPDNVQACEDKRLIMEENQRKYVSQCRWMPCF
jgi:hypothetical protein